MGKDSVKNFYEFLKKDASSVEELKKATKGVDTAEKATEVVISFAKSKGFEFTAEDIAEFEQDSQKELSLDELDKINAAGFTICFGVGFGNSDKGDVNCCKIVGVGIGVTLPGTKD